MNDIKALIVNKRKFLLTSILAVAVVCWFLGSTFVNLIHNKMELRRLTKLSAELDEQYEDLQQKKDLLEKQDPAYLERVLRVQYNMSASGETEFRFTTD